MPASPARSVETRCDDALALSPRRVRDRPSASLSLSLDFSWISVRACLLARPGVVVLLGIRRVSYVGTSI